MVDDARSRRCGKPSCEAPAAASLSFRYASGEVWLLDLAEPHPSRYDLCRAHAEALTVPRGWERVDERTAAVESIAPEAVEEDEAWSQVAAAGGRMGSSVGAGGGGPASSGRRRDRYAELAAQLPRLAAEVGADPDADDGADDEPDHGPDGDTRPRPPITSRGLTPPEPESPGGVVLAFERPERSERAVDGTGPPPAPDAAPDAEPDDGPDDDPPGNAS